MEFKNKSNPFQHDRDALACLRRARLQQSRIRSGRVVPAILPPSPDSIFWRVLQWIRAFFLRICFRSSHDPHHRLSLYQKRELEIQTQERKMAFFTTRAKEMEAELEKMLGIHERLVEENGELRQRVQDLGSKLGKSEGYLREFQLEQDHVYQRLHKEMQRLNAQCSEQQRIIEQLEQKVNRGNES